MRRNFRVRRDLEYDRKPSVALAIADDKNDMLALHHAGASLAGLSLWPFELVERKSSFGYLLGTQADVQTSVRAAAATIPMRMRFMSFAPFSNRIYAWCSANSTEIGRSGRHLLATVVTDTTVFL